VTKETHLRLLAYNITHKAALKYGTDNWNLKKKKHAKTRGNKNEILRALLGLRTVYKVRNREIRARLKEKKYSSINRRIT
jgi:hypothetical protein